MATEVHDDPTGANKMNENIAKMEDLTHRLVNALSHKRSPNPAVEAPGNALYARAITAYWQEAVDNPAKMIEQQAAFWGKTLRH